MKLNIFIEESDLKKLIDNNISFKECMSILNVSSRTLKKYRKLYGLSLDRISKNFNGICKQCGISVKYISTKEKVVYCSKSCSNVREHSKETKEKISNSLTTNNLVIIKCINCQEEKIVAYKRRNQKTCSRSCSLILRHKNDITLRTKIGLASVKSQNRRSKNEILFYEKCNKYFNSVENNLALFNGWDADIIIHDYKIAIMWNGIWHYEKITKNHSLKQVMNRDKIKIKEIINYGYLPYIIKDMGKFSEEKVENEFDILKKYVLNL